MALQRVCDLCGHVIENTASHFLLRIDRQVEATSETRADLTGDYCSLSCILERIEDVNQIRQAKGTAG